MAGTPTKIRSQPGVKRDGTRLEGNAYIDAQWCRWQRGLPRKIGGYFSAARDLPEKVYGIHSFSSNGDQYVHLGSAEQLQQRVLNSMGAVTGFADRTPAGLVPSDGNVWTFDVFFDTNDQINKLVAHVNPNLDSISSNFAYSNIFYGDVIGAGILVVSGQAAVSGGLLVVGNYLVSYGSNGFVQWSDENDPTGVLGDAAVTQQKVVAAKRVRGGGVPAALLWSLDSLLQMTFQPDPVDPAAIWDFDTITDETSILSSRCVIEYDGIFYWLGVDRPLMYNGVVREIPNMMNVNYFYDGLNEQQRQKVFAYKVPRFGEIWWCYPRGSATECTHAIIYNVREQTWYDTQLPDQGRTDGLYAKVYFKPFMTGVEETAGNFDLWQHETGVNRVRLASTQPIPSHFETHELSFVDADEDPQEKALRVERVEPDFVQVGDMTLTVRGRSNSRATVYDSTVRTFPEVASDADEQTVPLKENRRLMSFKFESNTIDGDYQMGDVLGHIEPTDGRVTQ